MTNSYTHRDAHTVRQTCKRTSSTFTALLNLAHAAVSLTEEEKRHTRAHTFVGELRLRRAFGLGVALSHTDIQIRI